MDLRSLALMRISLGLMSFAFFLVKFPFAHSFYSSQGLLDQTAISTFFHGIHSFNLLLFYSEPWFVYSLFILGFFLSLCFSLGVKTRICGWLLWFITLTLQGRFTLSLNGGDILLPLLFLWSNFLPVTRVFSFDSFLKDKNQSSFYRFHYFGWGNFAWFLQVILIYFMSGLYKDHPYWHSSGQALWLALNLDTFTTSIGSFLKGWVALLPWLSKATYFLELLGPFLLLIPIALVRLFLVLVFVSFHTGIFLTFDIGIFPFICMVMWLPFIPSFFWEKLAKYKFSFQLKGKKFEKLTFLSSAPYKDSLGKRTLIFFFCFLSLWYNLGDYSHLRKWQMQGHLRDASFLLGLDQRWDMFGPFPATREGWPIMVASLKNGSKVDPWNQGAIKFDKPKNPKYRSIFWRKTWERLSLFRYQSYRPHLVRFMCERWNRHHGLTQKQMESIHLYYLIEHSPISPQEKPHLKRDDLGSFSCVR